MNNKYKAHIALLVSTLIYAGNYTVAKEVMPDYVQPFGFIVMRVITAVTLYWLAHLLLVKEKIEKKDFKRLFLCGMFGVAINQLLFFKGLSLTTPINASLIMTTNPILVLLIAGIVVKETITVYKIAGIVIGAIGAIILILFGENFSFGSKTFLGDLFIFINSMSFGFYLVLVKSLMDKYHPLTVIKWVFLFGSFVVIPVGFEEFNEINFSTIPADIWLCILYVLLGTTFIAYLCNTFALKIANASLVSTYIYFQPLFASIIALMFGKDQITLLKIISSVCIFTGVYLVSKNFKSKFINL